MNGKRFISMMYRTMAVGVMMFVLAGVAALADPPQGRGNGKGKGQFNRRGGNGPVIILPGSGKKANKRKFVNGHDARDGRWDGRGPNRRRGGGFPLPW